MIQTVALIKRLPQLDREAFRAHYERSHVPLALPLLEGLARYVRYHVEADLFGDPSFDVISAFWYRDQEAVDRIFELLEGDHGAAIRADELRFMDKPANRFFPVSARLLRPGDEGMEPVFLLVARPEAMTRFECSKTLVRDHWPRLAEKLEKSVETAGFALLRDAFPFAGESAPWDALLQIRGEELEAGGGAERLREWGRALTREGFRIAAVRTRRFEQPV